MTFEAVFGLHPLVSALAFVHGLTLLISAPASILNRRNLKRLGLAVFAAAFALNSWVILSRWIEAGRPPFKTLFETMVFYPWCLGLVTITLIGLHRLHVLVPFSAAASLAGLAYALYRPDVEIINLPPALQSAWFVPHVVTYFVSYAALFASFVLALLSLAVPVFKKKTAESLRSGFENHAHNAVMFGFAALTLGLAMGGAWGKFAWGDYWSWDPKENWALVTWLAYLIYVHLRLVKGWRGRRAMIVLLCSFGAVVFTYLGMSLLPTASDSLHVYQSTP